MWCSIHASKRPAYRLCRPIPIRYSQEMEPRPLEDQGQRSPLPRRRDDIATSHSSSTCKIWDESPVTFSPKDGFLLVCSGGEEALGNLKGIKQIMKDYAGRIQAVYAYDGLYNQIVNLAPCHGGKYRVEIHAQGGHTYLNFGNPSAIVCAAAGLSTICTSCPLQRVASHSHNAGIWTGGEGAQRHRTAQ